jgi:Coenzyme PQQ synthesis protein D (PqqD)
MLALLERVPSVGAAVAPLAAEFDQPAGVIERDLRELCRALRDRGLISVTPTE